MVSEDEQRVLVLAPRGRDAALAVQLIQRHGFQASECSSADELAERIPHIGAAVITSEALTEPARAVLSAAIAAQPAWSDFPIVLFGPRGVDRADEAIEVVNLLGNVSILERPVNGSTLISAVVAALRARRRQYEARDAIRRRDQFLAMLGHELRNPLAAITLAIEALPQTDGAQPGDKQKAIIARQTRHLSRLVDDLLDVARVTSGKVRLQTAPLELSEVIERCIHGAELASDARRIELRPELARQPMIIDGDLVRLEEIFNNLIGNAIKYSPDGARITVKARREGKRCIVDVVDTGIGMAPEMIDRVFDLFAQADGSLDRSQGGLGIGLTLVRSLVELHGGTIRATSAGLGRGSTFTVELPVSRTASLGDTKSRLSIVEEPKPVRVLLVEDNPDLLEMTKDLLELAGCTVSCAADGDEGLARLLAHPPDVAFIDIGLPSLDGFEIARRARAGGVTSFLVAMTGYGQPDDQQRAQAAGFDKHLTKPVSVAALHEAMAVAHKAAARRVSNGG